MDFSQHKHLSSSDYYKKSLPNIHVSISIDDNEIVISFENTLLFKIKKCVKLVEDWCLYNNINYSEIVTYTDCEGNFPTDVVLYCHSRIKA